MKKALLCGASLAFSYARGQNRPPEEKPAREAKRDHPAEYGLIRSACLAANSHNAQAWTFRAESGRILIRPDWSRRCPHADPHDHHLWASIGCAVENIVQAAPGVGKRAEVTIAEGGQPEVAITLIEEKEPSNAPLAGFIPLRQCTRCEYDGKPIRTRHLTELKNLATDRGVEARLIMDDAERRVLETLILEANAVQVQNTEFRRELKKWLRFNEKDARSTGDGLFSACSGNPEIPAWMGNLLFDVFHTANSANETLAVQLKSSSGLLLLHSDRNDNRQWIEAGRSVQRFALQITALGMKMAFVNQPLEIESFKPRLLSALNLSERYPEALIRIGYALPMPRSFRRPLESVIS